MQIATILLTTMGYLATTAVATIFTQQDTWPYPSNGVLGNGGACDQPVYCVSTTSSKTSNITLLPHPRYINRNTDEQYTYRVLPFKPRISQTHKRSVRTFMSNRIRTRKGQGRRINPRAQV
ncbi:hypothetical protein HYALB_00006493 [Hymenoscyphus albidus]|uniref:Secreted protein n=1 Tax=Hymenoscyphus albidus TaxID=595503 RepID=A0A9N9LKP2_9HELO|nr:hypothetical protein HYALB_00006493 [Hymenoscyphus albidus]